MSSPLFPVEVEIFKAAIEFHDFRSGDILRPYDGVTLHTAPLDHPDGASGYRLEFDGARVRFDQRHVRISRQTRPRTGVARPQCRPDRL